MVAPFRDRPAVSCGQIGWTRFPALNQSLGIHRTRRLPDREAGGEPGPVPTRGERRAAGPESRHLRWWSDAGADRAGAACATPTATSARADVAATTTAKAIGKTRIAKYPNTISPSEPTAMPRTAETTTAASSAAANFFDVRSRADRRRCLDVERSTSRW